MPWWGYQAHFLAFLAVVWIFQELDQFARVVVEAIAQLRWESHKVLLCIADSVAHSVEIVVTGEISEIAAGLEVGQHALGMHFPHDGVYIARIAVLWLDSGFGSRRDLDPSRSVLTC